MGCEHEYVVHAWQGIGIEQTLEEIVKRIPAPQDTAKKPLRALIFDSHYDSYKVCVLAHTSKRYAAALCIYSVWHLQTTTLTA